MILNKKMPIHKLAKVDHTYPALNAVQFKNGYAYVTDGVCALKVSMDTLCVDISDEEQKMLDGKAVTSKTFEHLLKCGHVEVGQDCITSTYDFDTVRFSYVSDKLRLPSIDKFFLAKMEIVVVPRDSDLDAVGIVMPMNLKE